MLRRLLLLIPFLFVGLSVVGQTDDKDKKIIFDWWVGTNASASVQTPIVTAPTAVGSNFILNTTYNSYQWKRNGSDISGATSATYTATTGDLFKFISVTVNGSLTSAEVEFEDPSVVWMLDPANTTTMFQETFVSGGTTPSTSNTNPVGAIYNIAKGGFFLNTTTNVAVPTLSSSGTRNSFVVGNTLALLDNSNTMKRYLRFIHAVAPVWGVQFWVKVDTDGTTKEYWFTKTTGGATTAGVHVRITTTGAVFVRMGNQTITTATITTTATINVASGWVPIYIYVNGTGVNASKIKVGSAAEEQFTVAAGAAVDAASGFTWFGTGLSSGTFILRNRIPTAAEIADFALHNPARNSDDWISERWLYDFNNTVLGFSDVGETVNVTNGSVVRSWINGVTLAGSDIGRKLTSASDAVSCTYATNLKEGKGGLNFDAAAGAGRDAALDLLSFMFTEIGLQTGMMNPDGCGKALAAIVGKNRDAVDGSHMVKTENYWAWTGVTYRNPDPPDQVRHGQSGQSAGRVPFVHYTTSPAAQDFDWGGWTRSGGTEIHYNVNQGTLTTNSLTNPFGKATSQFGSRMSSVTNVWAMDGNNLYFRDDAGSLTATRYVSIYLTPLKTAYGL